MPNSARLSCISFGVAGIISVKKSAKLSHSPGPDVTSSVLIRIAGPDLPVLLLFVLAFNVSRYLPFAMEDFCYCSTPKKEFFESPRKLSTYLPHADSIQVYETVC